MHTRSALLSTALLLAGAAALTGCRHGDTDTVGGAAPTRPAGASSASASTADPSPPGPSGSGGSGGSGASGGSTATASRPAGAPTATTPGAPTSGSGKPGAQGTGSGSGDATSDSYAWTHPCSSRQISVQVVRRAAAPTQRVIQVRNNGARACGLSYYPHVVLWDSGSATGGVTVVPLVPDGLGGPPASPLYAGRTAYAVVDLDPSGATKGAAAGVDAMNVLADGEHMSSRETRGFPLGAGAHVLAPKLGLYERTVADAVTSMRSADIHP